MYWVLFLMKTDLLIWNAAESIVWIFPLKIDDELCELVVMTKSIYGVL